MPRPRCVGMNSARPMSPSLQGARLGPHDPVLLRGAERLADDGITRAEHVRKLRPGRPPFLDLRARRQAPLRLAALEMTGGSENEHLAATALQFDEILEVFGHDQVTDAKHPCVGTGVASAA